jgi:monoamine oxidase
VAIEADTSVAGFVARVEEHEAVATYIGPMDFAADADEISAVDIASAADLDPNYLLAEGFGTVVHRWGGDVAVELSTPVRRLRWDGPGIVAETDRGDVKARAAVVTVSTGILAFGGLQFSPDLPETVETAIHNLPMGLLTKIPLEIRGDRLGIEPHADFLIERPGQHDIYFLAWPFDTDLLVGFVGGDFAWELTAAGAEAAIDFAVQSLSRTFGSDITLAEMAAYHPTTPEALLRINGVGRLKLQHYGAPFIEEIKSYLVQS